MKSELHARLPAFPLSQQGARPRWLIFAINLLLVMWVGYQVTRLVQMFLSTPGEEVLSGSVRVTMPARTPVAISPSADDLTELHLFGVAVAEQPPRVQDMNEVPDTQLKVALHGTFVTGESRFGHAIIADNSGDEGSYSIGDEIQDGAEVYEILIDRVILKRNQHYEILRLFGNEESVQVADTGETAIRVTAKRNGKAALATVKRQPLTLDDMVRPWPVHQDGRFIGFRLEPRKDPELLIQMGLQRDDVVTWLNDKYLDNPLKGMRALRGVSTGDYVNMTVRRDGEERSMSFYMP